MFDLREEQERVILVGVQENGGANAEESLDELAELASTAGAKVEGRLVQVREAIHPGTYIGKGKLEELKILVRACDATGIICDDELSSIQLKGLEEALEWERSLFGECGESRDRKEGMTAFLEKRPRVFTGE